jgi:hypothetical protein
MIISYYVKIHNSLTEMLMECQQTINIIIGRVAALEEQRESRL